MTLEIPIFHRGSRLLASEVSLIISGECDNFDQKRHTGTCKNALKRVTLCGMENEYSTQNIIENALLSITYTINLPRPAKKPEKSENKKLSRFKRTNKELLSESYF